MFSTLMEFTSYGTRVFISSKSYKREDSHPFSQKLVDRWGNIVRHLCVCRIFI